MPVTAYPADTDSQLTHHLTTHTVLVCFHFGNFSPNATSNLYCLKVCTTQHFQPNLSSYFNLICLLIWGWSHLNALAGFEFTDRLPGPKCQGKEKKKGSLHCCLYLAHLNIVKRLKEFLNATVTYWHQNFSVPLGKIVYSFLLNISS